MAKGGRSAAKKAPRAAARSTVDLNPDYSAFPDTAKGRAMAREAARKARDQKTEAKGEDVTILPSDVEQETA